MPFCRLEVTTLNPAWNAVWGYNSISCTLSGIRHFLGGEVGKLRVRFSRRMNVGKAGLDFVVIVCEFGWGGKLGKGFSGQVKKYLRGGVISLIVRNYMRHEIVRCLC